MNQISHQHLDVSEHYQHCSPVGNLSYWQSGTSGLEILGSTEVCRGERCRLVPYTPRERAYCCWPVRTTASFHVLCVDPKETPFRLSTVKIVLWIANGVAYSRNFKVLAIQNNNTLLYCKELHSQPSQHSVALFTGEGTLGDREWEDHSLEHTKGGIGERKLENKIPLHCG